MNVPGRDEIPFMVLLRFKVCSNQARNIEWLFIRAGAQQFQKRFNDIPWKVGYVYAFYFG